MHYSTRGISLVKYKYGEESIIAKIFTEDFGLLSFSVKRGRGKKSKNKISLLQSLSLISLSAQTNNKSEVHILKEIGLAYSLENSYLNINKQLLRVFMAEVLTKILFVGEKYQRIFDFIWTETQIINNDEKISVNYAISFLLSLTYFLGFYPSKENMNYDFFDLETASFIPSAIITENIISGKNLNNLKKILLNNGGELHYKDRKTLLKIIIQYYKAHHYNLDNLKSHEIIESLR